MSNEDKRKFAEFESVERPGSQKRSQSSPRSVKMWVLFEGEEEAEKFVLQEEDFKDWNEFISADLDDFKRVLRKHEPFLKGVKNKKIVLFNESLERLDPTTNLSSLDVGECSATKIIVRYPISAVNIKVTFVYGQKQGKREIPHTSGSFNQLQALAREVFEDLEGGTIYFVNDGTEIWNAHNFNTVVESQTAQDNNIVLKLKVLIKGRKKYSDWKLPEVFKDILGKPNYNSLSDMQRLDMKEFSPLDPPLKESRLTDFAMELKRRFNSFQGEFGSEQKNRVYIDAFMVHAVDYIRTNINESVILDVEKRLSGSHGYGPIDYWIKFIETLLLLCEAKAEDMNQGVAQVIVQMQSGIEQLSGQGHEKSIYGIASTGKLWRFIHWSGSTENPDVCISKEYMCDFKGRMKSEKKVLTYIIKLIMAQINL